MKMYASDGFVSGVCEQSWRGCVDEEGEGMDIDIHTSELSNMPGDQTPPPTSSWFSSHHLLHRDHLHHHHHQCPSPPADCRCSCSGDGLASKTDGCISFPSPLTPHSTDSTDSEDSSPTARDGAPRWSERLTPLWRGRVARAHVLCLALLSCVGVSVCRPYPELSRYARMDTNQQSMAVKYLAQFGYLTGPSQETRNLMSAMEFTKAVKSLQRMGHIDETGVIDEPTVRLMMKPRCGNMDSMARVIPGEGRSDLGHTWDRRRFRRYTKAPTKWHKKDLTYGFRNYTQDLDVRTVKETIRDAFHLWSNATQLRFSEKVHEEADIMIQFSSRYHLDGYPFDGKGMILAHAFFPGVGREGDTHFDDDETWTINSTDGVDLFMVAAHEFGHALGLAHSADPRALMYPWYQGFSGKFVLPRDDTQGIQELYGPPQGDREFPATLIPQTDNRGDTPRRGYDVNPTPRGDDSGPPDPCTTPFDAITIIRSEVFLFIGKWFWRLNSHSQMKEPVQIHKFWYGLPPEVTKIDAVLERPGDKRIIFFFGDRYWMYNANRMVSGFPKEGQPITEFGIPADVKRIDTVFTWGFNNRTYLVSGTMYWKLDENNTHVEYDYPRDMSIWRDVGVPLDAAFQYWDGKTYFFKDKMYWKFYDIRMRVDKAYPRFIAKDWLQCSDDKPAQHRKDEQTLDKERTQQQNDNSAASVPSGPLPWLALVLFLSLLDHVCIKCT